MVIEGRQGYDRANNRYDLLVLDLWEMMVYIAASPWRSW